MYINKNESKTKEKGQKYGGPAVVPIERLYYNYIYIFVISAENTAMSWGAYYHYYTNFKFNLIENIEKVIVGAYPKLKLVKLLFDYGSWFWRKKNRI